MDEPAERWMAARRTAIAQHIGAGDVEAATAVVGEIADALPELPRPLALRGTAGGAGAGWLAMRLTSARYADAVETAFDVHRFALYRALVRPLPTGRRTSVNWAGR